MKFIVHSYVPPQRHPIITQCALCSEDPRFCGETS